MNLSEKEIFEYHRKPKPGKIEIRPSKPLKTQRDLSIAYTPGVAKVVLSIEENPENAYEYTAKANLVAVISNGTAILGLGDRGALASKPVMEGKAVLFKNFADIDAIDIEVDEKDPDRFIHVVKSIAPTFGGINLEDIKAPDCFYIEEKLVEMLDIPVFHDDQHGTAIITLAALINALELQNKKIEDVKIVIVGAGAAGIAIGRLLRKYGARHILLLDSKGVIYKGRKERMNPYKEEFAVDTDARTLDDAMKGADVFIGVSVANLLNEEHLRSMADRPIIFALANPDPEVDYYTALQVRPDAIVATGRSDFPNQVNNLLGFPYIFRGALDVRARVVNDEMKIAAAEALAELARQEVTEETLRAYGVEKLVFGKEYIIPKPLDPRIIYWVAPAVAKAAIESGVARRIIDIDQYRESLKDKFSPTFRFMRYVINKAKSDPKTIVYPEGEDERVIRAASHVVNEGIARVVLVGREDIIRQKIEEYGITFAHEPRIVNPRNFDRIHEYTDTLYRIRQRRGFTWYEVSRIIYHPIMFSLVMLARDEVDAFVGGVTYNYSDILRRVLQVIGKRPEYRKVAGAYILIIKRKLYMIADATVNADLDAEDIADIAYMSYIKAKRYGIKPRIAFISFSNFGSSRHPEAVKARRAFEILSSRHPEILADGEMQADVAVDVELLNHLYPFSHLRDKGANILIFPNLDSANSAYKLLWKLADGIAIGPLLMGLKKAAHIVQQGDSVEAIYNLSIMAVVDAQSKKEY